MTEEKMSRNDPDPHHIIDITHDLCPMTFVKTRLALDRMAEGETLLVLLKGVEPIANVPRAAAALGHGVSVETANEEGIVRVFITKGGAFSPAKGG